ncbi:hypothetical protein TNCV_3960071 [Trichonephila clavipes]|nr:hypothetical protein TNCV_3960071 [Trichonephila clavipes]
MARRNHLDYFTRGKMIGNLEEGRSVTSVVAEFGINKRVSFCAFGKRSKPQVQLFERLMVAARGRQLQGMTDISSCRRKTPTAVSKRHCSATLYSNGATSVAVYCGQTPSQRRPICPPS